MNMRRDGSTRQHLDAPVGAVLAGGASRRMGWDKALSGLPALAAERLKAVCAEVAVADRGRGLLPGLPSLPDGLGPEGGGPAAGILGVAAAYPGRPLLVLACDLPRVPVELLAELASSGAWDWAVPRWDRGLEPLCALYGPAALAVLVEKGLRAPHRLAEEDLAIRYLEGDDLARFGPPEEVFLNLNTPEDLERYTSRAFGTSP